MKYSNEFINHALELRSGGMSVGDVCRKLNISSSTLRGWEIDNMISIPQNLSNTQIILHLKSRLYEALRESEIWNQCTCCRKSKLSEKYADLVRLVPEYGVHAVCKVLDVPRATYYNHVLWSLEKTKLQKHSLMFT